MAKITQQPSVSLTLKFEIDEAEARALGWLADNHSVASYEYNSLPREKRAALCRFADDMRKMLQPALANLDAARKAFENSKTK